MGKHCRSCGTQIAPGAQFCASCGAFLGGAPSATGSSLSHKPVSRSSKSSFIVIIVSVVLILLGIQNMSLRVVGKNTVALITDAQLDTRSYGSNLPDPNRYRIKYEFNVDGKNYSGATTQTFKQGILSGQTIYVRYLPFSPGINTTDDEAKVTVGLLIMGLGILLLVLGIKGRIGGRWGLSVGRS